MITTSPCKKRVSNLAYNSTIKRQLSEYGLTIGNVTWEDTARNKNSCWGPNISDMTLVLKDGTKMPVIRAPNFEDPTEDLNLSSFSVPVGNEKGVASRMVSLDNYLRNLDTYLPEHTSVESINLLKDDETTLLASSQCCVLPVDKKGEVEFAVQLFNYQSRAKHPAVLVLMVSKDGTSAQVVERGTTKLHFRLKDRKRWFKVERLQDVQERRTGQPQAKLTSFSQMTREESLENALLMIQIPLQVPEIVSRGCPGPWKALCVA